MLKLKLQYFGQLFFHVKSWLIGKDPDAGRDWGQEEKGMTEDEMAGLHHLLDTHEFGWTPGVGDGQGGLACCNSRGHKESDMTEQLNWTETLFRSYLHYSHREVSGFSLCENLSKLGAIRRRVKRQWWWNQGMQCSLVGQIGWWGMNRCNNIMKRILKPISIQELF